MPVPFGPDSPLSLYWYDELLFFDVAFPIIQALLNGDRRIVKTLKEAIKEMDHIYHRNLEPELLRKAWEYRLGEGRGLGVEEFKKGLEARVNHGKPFAQYRWDRIRKRLFLPKRATGAAASSYTHRPKRKGKPRLS
jgi:hypothetical protein